MCLSVCAEAQSLSWQKLYNGPGIFYDDEGYGICKADSDNLYIIGKTLININPFSRIYLIKINKFGDTLWTRTFIASGESNSDGLAITSSDNGSCVLTGRSDSAFTIKVGPDGNILWKKNYFNDGTSHIKIIRTIDNGYAMLSSTSELMKLDSSGNFVWKYSYQQYFNIGCFTESYDGNFIVSGHNWDSSFIAKISSIGNIVWVNGFRIRDFLFSPESIIKANTGYSVSGFASIGGLTVCKFDSSGNLINYISYQPDTLERHSDLKLYKNKHYLLLSNVEEQNVSHYSKLRVLDTSGAILTTKYFRLSEGNRLRQIEIANNNDVLFIGEGDDKRFPGSENIYCIRTDSTFNAPPVIGINSHNSIINNFSLRQNYPNPFNPSTKISYSLKKSSEIELKLFDINGRLVKIIESGFKPDGSYEINFSVEGLSSGVYFFSLYSKGILMDTKKAVMIK